MGINLENFNRIIDIVFIPTEKEGPANKSDLATVSVLTGKYNNGKVKSIICPRNGIKPQIEINGTFGSALVLEAFDITIKNLYLDILAEPYSKIKVRAGYANNYTTIEANIINMYQESPGPEGTTVIQCQQGQVTKQWLDAMVSLNFEAKSKLNDILQNIKKKLNISEVYLGKQARNLTLEEPLQFDGSARSALSLLQERFAAKNLQIIFQGSKLCAICTTDGDFVNSRVLQYMSAPPQKNPGDSEGNWQTMITAPWMPDLKPGDQLIIPSNVYVNNGQVVGGAKKTQKMEITQMSFHFGTRGTVNQMTCEGFIVR